MADAIGRAVIDLEANSSSLEAGMARGIKAVERFEDKAVQSAGKAAQALGGSGKAVAEAGQQMDAASRRFIASLEREAMQVGRTRSEYLELRAAKLGAGGAADPFLAQIRAGEKGLQGLGNSAKQTRAAMRLLPAQITDVVTSLASGQPAYLVAIQQGGQIKDSFGGVGATFRALKGAISPAVLGFTTLAAAAGAVAFAYARGSSEADAYTKAIVMSGNAAGVTRDQLADMARSIDGVVGTQGAAAAALAQLTATGSVARGNLEQFATTAIMLDRVAGKAVADTVKEFAALGKDPVSASIKLNEQYGYLTLSVFDQVRALKEQGRALEAVSVAQRAFDTAMSERAKTLEGNLGSLERAWRGLKDRAKEAWNAMLGIGRAETLDERLAAASDRVLALRGRRRRLGGTERNDGLDPALQNQAELQELQRLRRRGGDSQAAAVEGNRAAIEARSENQKWADLALNTQQKINKALDEYRRNNEAIKAAGGTLDPRQVAREEAAIRKSLTPQRAVTDDAATRMLADIREQAEAIEAQANGLDKLTASERKLVEFNEQIAGLKEKRILTAEQKSLLASQEQIRVGLQKNALAEREAKTKEQLASLERKALEDAASFTERQDAGRDRDVEDIDKSNEKLRDEIAVLLAGVDARHAVEQARLSSANALAEEQLLLNANIEGMDRENERLREEIRLREQRIGLLGDKKEAQDFKEAQDEMAKDAERTRQSIEGTLGDSLKAGLKGDFDSIGQMWANLLLDMVSKAIAADIMNALFRDTGGSSGFGSFLSAFASIFAGGMAEGGHIPAGKVALVGEEGPEFAVGPAQIIPMDKVGGAGGGMTIVLDYRGMSIGAGVSRNEVMVAMHVATNNAVGQVAEAARRGNRWVPR